MKRLIAFVVVALAFGGPAFAQTADTSPGSGLGGYTAQSSAEAFSVQPYLPALISTGNVPVEGTIALSTSNVTSGGNSFARGAALWLGSAAGDPGPLIGEGAGQPMIGALFPKWPVQAQATQDDGEVTTGEAPLIAMTADGFPDHSAGDTRLADISVPGLVHIEHTASTSTSVVKTSEVDNDARVVLHGISLLNGHITIDQILSYSATTSNGTTSTQSGKLAISGLSIGGVGVTVTDKGFQITGRSPTPGTSPQDAVDAVLAAFHARLTLYNAAGSAVGGTADRVGGALVLSIDNPVGGIGPIPPGRFDIILGSTSSTAQASPMFSLGGTDLGGGSSVGGVEIPRTGSPSSISLGTGPAPVNSTLPGVSAGTPQAIGSSGVTGLQSSDYQYKGLPIALVMVLLVVAGVASIYIRRFMLKVIGT